MSEIRDPEAKEHSGFRPAMLASVMFAGVMMVAYDTAERGPSAQWERVKVTARPAVDWGRGLFQEKKPAELAPGLTLNEATGVIGGTPTTVGTFTINVTDAEPSGEPLAYVVAKKDIGPSGIQLVERTILHSGEGLRCDTDDYTDNYVKMRIRYDAKIGRPFVCHWKQPAAPPGHVLSDYRGTTTMFYDRTPKDAKR